MFEFLKSDGFNYIGSAILGIGIIIIFKPICTSKECVIQKAPPVNEVTKKTYQIAGKCYQFKTSEIKCPDRGIIEPFQSRL